MSGVTGPETASPGYWLLVGCAIAANALVAFNIFTAVRNDALREEVSARQQYLSQSMELSRLHSELVQGLANLAARTGDEALRALLERQGIRFTVTAADTGAAPMGEGSEGRDDGD